MCQALCQVLVTQWSLIDGGNDPTWQQPHLAEVEGF